MYKPDEIEFTPRHKQKGKSKAGKLEKRKQGVKFQRLQEQVKQHRLNMNKSSEEQESKPSASFNVFNRFKKTSW